MPLPLAMTPRPAGKQTAIELGTGDPGPPPGHTQLCPSNTEPPQEDTEPPPGDTDQITHRTAVDRLTRLNEVPLYREEATRDSG